MQALDDRQALLLLKGRAMRLLAQREHTRPELERKLAPHAPTPEMLAEALDALAAKGFINEARVVESVLRQRASRLGAARVRHELHSRGVADAALADAEAQLRSTELERARAVWQKKFGTPAADPAARAKQIRFLLGRGFAAEVVRKVVAGGEDFAG